MLLTLVLWMVMGLTAYAVGIGLVPPQALACAGDRHLAAVWVGFVVASNLWLALALVMPLTWGPVLGITALGVAGLWLYRRREPEWTLLPPFHSIASVPWWLWVVGVSVLGGLALLSAQTVTTFDTGLYHYQAVRWLEACGVVPGMASVFFQLGYASAWFAFVAPFEVGWWQHRMGVAGGFFLALLWLHGWLALWRAWRREAQVADWFMLLAGGLVLVVTVHLGQLASLSTDTPTAALIVAAVWGLLATKEQWAAHQAATLSTWTVWTPLLLAGGALTVKLTAAPVVAVTTGWALWQLYRQPFARRGLVLVTPVALMVLLLIPTTTARWVSSGYLFFPSSLLGWYLPDWACEPQTLSVATRGVRDFARWTWWQSPEAVRYSRGWMDFSWLPQWLGREALMTTYLGLAVVAGSVFVRRFAGRAGGAHLWVVALAWSGLMYVFVTAPTLRFALGFLVILLALWQAELIQRAERWGTVVVGGLVFVATMTGVFYERPLGRVTLAATVVVAAVGWVLVTLAWQWSQVLGGAALAALLCLPVPLTILRTHPRPQLWWVMPARLPSQPTRVVMVNDVPLHTPTPPAGAYPLCWGSPLPCTVEVNPKLSFRDPQRGLAGGFKRRTL